MLDRFGVAKKLEELRVYQQAVAFVKAVTAILDRPAYRKDRDLSRQTSEANDSIPSNIAEGFEQGSDRMFVKYLFYAKGSVGEVISRLRSAHIKRYITDGELHAKITAADTLSRSLGALIRYLDACAWQDRGRHQSRLRAQGLPRGPKDSGPTDPGPADPGPRTGD